MIVKEKVALITGGASGLGLCFAKELLRNGLKGVCLADINAEEAEELIPSIEQEFGQNKAIFVKIDVTNEVEFKEAFEKTIHVFKNVDILINCAGVTDERNQRRAIDINLNAVICGTLLAMDDYLPKYRSSEDESVIINIASVLGLDGCQFGPVYTAAKHGVVGLSKCLGTERHYKETGVKILTICPAFTDTPMVRDLEKKVLPGRYCDILQEILPQLPVQETEVVASALVKILQKFETGAVWVIENGKCYQVEIPTRFTLRKKRVLEI